MAVKRIDVYGRSNRDGHLYPHHTILELNGTKVDLPTREVPNVIEHMEETFFQVIEDAVKSGDEFPIPDPPGPKVARAVTLLYMMESMSAPQAEKIILSQEFSEHL